MQVVGGLLFSVTSSSLQPPFTVSSAFHACISIAVWVELHDKTLHFLANVLGLTSGNFLLRRQDCSKPNIRVNCAWVKCRSRNSSLKLSIHRYVEGIFELASRNDCVRCAMANPWLLLTSIWRLLRVKHRCLKSLLSLLFLNKSATTYIYPSLIWSQYCVMLGVL